MMKQIKYIINRQFKVYIQSILFLEAIYMKVKVFDESHEKDLEDDIKKFIENDKKYPS